jgi:ADP-heptose:LPS heptosyltransferase
MIGDVLATSIVCNNLRTAYPNAKIDYLIYPFTAPAVENNPNINRLVLFDDKYRKNRRAFLSFLFAMREEQYDIVIDAYGKIESLLVTAFSGANKKIGFYKFYQKFFYSDTVKELTVPQTNAGLAIENRIKLLEPLNLKIAIDNRPKIYLTPSEIEKGKQILKDVQVDFSKKVYMIGVLGSSINKTYPFQYMANILDQIVAATGATLLFNYMPSQRDEVQNIFQLCEANTQNNIKVDLIPRSIREFLAVTSHCDALIGNEGGSVNMAKALNKPTFTIFSPWIIKNAWNSFENSTTHISVHLEDFKPELYGKKNAKEMKSDSLKLYLDFTPDLILPRLKSFLETN